MHSILTHHFFACQKLVPIPIVSSVCKKRCCLRKYVPLTLAFARTIHKFQGLSAGPVNEGKIPNMYKYIICDPDLGTFEGSNPGLLYTAISRATTLGEDDGLGSAIYFEGADFNASRIKYVGKSTCRYKNFEEFELFKKRRAWTSYLSAHTKTETGLSSEQTAGLFLWCNSAYYDYNALDLRIKAYKKAVGIKKPTTHSHKPKSKKKTEA